MKQNAPGKLEIMRQELIKKLLAQREEINRQLEQLGHKDEK